MEASTEYIRESCIDGSNGSFYGTSTDSANFHVFPWTLALTSMAVNLLPSTSIEISMEANLLPPTCMEVSIEVIFFHGIKFTCNEVSTEVNLFHGSWWKIHWK